MERLVANNSFDFGSQKAESYWQSEQPNCLASDPQLHEKRCPQSCLIITNVLCPSPPTLIRRYSSIDLLYFIHHNDRFSQFRSQFFNASHTLLTSATTWNSYRLRHHVMPSTALHTSATTFHMYILRTWAFPFPVERTSVTTQNISELMATLLPGLHNPWRHISCLLSQRVTQAALSTTSQLRWMICVHTSWTPHSITLRRWHWTSTLVGGDVRHHLHGRTHLSHFAPKSFGNVSKNIHSTKAEYNILWMMIPHYYHTLVISFPRTWCHLQQRTELDKLYALRAEWIIWSSLPESSLLLSTMRLNMHDKLQRYQCISFQDRHWRRSLFDAHHRCSPPTWANYTNIAALFRDEENEHATFQTAVQRRRYASTFLGQDCKHPR